MTFSLNTATMSPPLVSRALYTGVGALQVVSGVASSMGLSSLARSIDNGSRGLNRVALRFATTHEMEGWGWSDVEKAIRTVVPDIDLDAFYASTDRSTVEELQAGAPRRNDGIAAVALEGIQIFSELKGAHEEGRPVGNPFERVSQLFWAVEPWLESHGVSPAARFHLTRAAMKSLGAELLY